MAIVQAGSINTTAQIVPGLTTQIVKPSVPALNGVPTDRILIVGTAPGGPVNQPVVVSDVGSYEAIFGPIQNRKFDAGTQLATAYQQGAKNFVVVRVTDTTETKSSKVHQVASTTAVTFTALFPGSYGNSITYQFLTGSKASTFKAIISVPNIATEVYDNLPSTGSAFWPALVDAINSGNTLYARAGAPSKLVTATVGTSTTAPTVPMTAVALTGGTDGVATITAATLVGQDSLPRKGMYAARKMKASVGILADTDDSTTWSAQASFGAEEGIYMILTGALGEASATAITNKASAGIDTYSAKVMLGDWLYWADPRNFVTRLVSPQGFVAGKLANLSPEQSTLNKQLSYILGSQKLGQVGTGTLMAYSDAELSDLFQAGIDVIANPAPGGNYWAVRGGLNASSDNTINGDNYTRMTNYIAATTSSASMGAYVGQVINTTTMQSVEIALEHFLSTLVSAGTLARQEDGSLPYSVQCNAANNPRALTDNGYLTATVKVRYQAITRFFILNNQGGQTVTVEIQPA